MNINVARNGQQIGTFPLDEINRRLASGALLASDLGWKDGMGAWQPLGSLPGVQLPGSGVPAATPASSAGIPAAPANTSVPTFHPSQSYPASGSKQQYLAALRVGTAYPGFRRSISILAVFGYILAGIELVATVVVGSQAMRYNSGQGLLFILGGILITALLIVGVQVWQGAATILADLGDASAETNSRR